MNHSLRNRLVVGTVAATLGIFAIAAAVLYVGIRSALLSEFDAALRARAQSLMSITEQDAGAIKIDPEPLGVPEFRRDAAEYFLLRDASMKTVAVSDSLAGAGWNPPETLPSGKPAFSFVTLPGGLHGRLIAVQFTPRAESDSPSPAATSVTANQAIAHLIVARNTREFDVKLVRLAWLLGGVFVLTTLVSAGLMGWVVTRGLRPLTVLAHRIEEIDDRDLARRIDLSSPPEEMRPVIARLNELLAGLERAFGRERAFTADVAHELRTPLAGVISTLEVCAMQRRPPEEYERVIERCIGASKGMQTMVENLLTLARADAQQIQPAQGRVDVAQVLQDEWRFVEPQAMERRLNVQWSLGDDLAIATDEGLLRVVVRNLLDNATSYCDAGGEVQIAAAIEAGQILLVIRNTGSEVPPEDASRVFDRFWRGDAARSGVGRHSGLGLALCQRVVTLLGGTISVTTVLRGDFTVTLTLTPSASPEPLG